MDLSASVSCIFIVLLKFGFSISKVSYVCPNERVISVVLDSSKTVTNGEFNEQKDFVLNILDYFHKNGKTLKMGGRIFYKSCPAQEEPAPSEAFLPGNNVNQNRREINNLQHLDSFDVFDVSCSLSMTQELHKQLKPSVSSAERHGIIFAKGIAATDFIANSYQKILLENNVDSLKVIVFANFTSHTPLLPYLARGRIEIYRVAPGNFVQLEPHIMRTICPNLITTNPIEPELKISSSASRLQTKVLRESVSSSSSLTSLEQSISTSSVNDAGQLANITPSSSYPETVTSYPTVLVSLSSSNLEHILSTFSTGHTSKFVEIPAIPTSFMYSSSVYPNHAESSASSLYISASFSSLPSKDGSSFDDTKIASTPFLLSDTTQRLSLIHPTSSSIHQLDSTKISTSASFHISLASSLESASVPIVTSTMAVALYQSNEITTNLLTSILHRSRFTQTLTSPNIPITTSYIPIPSITNSFSNDLISSTLQHTTIGISSPSLIAHPSLYSSTSPETALLSTFVMSSSDILIVPLPMTEMKFSNLATTHLYSTSSFRHSLVIAGQPISTGSHNPTLRSLSLSAISYFAPISISTMYMGVTSTSVQPIESSISGSTSVYPVVLPGDITSMEIHSSTVTQSASEIHSEKQSMPSSSVSVPIVVLPNKLSQFLSSSFNEVRASVSSTVPARSDSMFFSIGSSMVDSNSSTPSAAVGPLPAKTSVDVFSSFIDYSSMISSSTRDVSTTLSSIITTQDVLKHSTTFVAIYSMSAESVIDLSTLVSTQPLLTTTYQSSQSLVRLQSTKNVSDILPMIVTQSSILESKSPYSSSSITDSLLVSLPSFESLSSTNPTSLFPSILTPTTNPLTPNIVNSTQSLDYPVISSVIELISPISSEMYSFVTTLTALHSTSIHSSTYNGIDAMASTVAPSQSLLATSSVNTQPSANFVSVAVNQSLDLLPSSLVNSIFPILPSYVQVPTSSSVVVVDILDPVVVSFLNESTNVNGTKNSTWIKKYFDRAETIVEKVSQHHSPIQKKAGLKIIEKIEYVSLKIANQIEPGKEIIYIGKNMSIKISAINPNNFTGFIFDPTLNSENAIDGDSITLPANVFDNNTSLDNVAVVAMSYEPLSTMKYDWRESRIASNIITLTLDPPVSGPLDPPLVYSINAPKKNANETPLCVFWDITESATPSGGWSQEGCSMSSINGTLVTCQCSHMTHFGVLMQIHNIEQAEIIKFTLTVVTYVGCGISILGCLLLMLTFTVLSKLLHVDRNVVHFNLALAIAVANIIFLCAEPALQNKYTCLAASVGMFYFYLAAFFWMFIEGIHVYLMVVKVFKSPRKVRAYMVIGWVIPALVVGITAIRLHDDFITDDFCWLSAKTGVIWAFVGPVLFIIAVNSIILLITLKASYKMAIAHEEYTRLKVMARLTLLLMPIFGLTWVFGILSVNEHLVAFQYAFTAINSFQGLFIFICYCLMNSEVRREFELAKKHSSYNDSSSSTPSSRGGTKGRRRPQRGHRLSTDTLSPIRTTSYIPVARMYNNIESPFVAVHPRSSYRQRNGLVFSPDSNKMELLVLSHQSDPHRVSDCSDSSLVPPSCGSSDQQEDQDVRDYMHLTDNRAEDEMSVRTDDKLCTFTADEAEA